MMTPLAPDITDATRREFTHESVPVTAPVLDDATRRQLPATFLAPDLLPVDDATRRQFLAALGAAGLLTACGADTAAPGGPAAGAGFPRTVDFPGGSVEVPSPPQRVFLGNGATGLDCLLALGVVPVGHCEEVPERRPWQQIPGMEDVPTTAYELDLEAVAAMRPDLAVLENFVFEQFGEQVASLCPTAAFNSPTDPLYPDANLTLLGQLLGREADAARILADYERSLTDFAASIPDAPSLTVFYWYGGGSGYVYGPELQSGRFLASAGVPLRLRDGDPKGVELSLENLGLLDDELLVAITESEAGQAAYDELESEPLFRSIPAVRDGRYLRLTPDEGAAITRPSPLAAPTALGAVERMLAR